MDHLYLYFSGTGNTKYVVEAFAKELHQGAVIQSIEHDNIDYETLLASYTNITFAYPIYESMMPFIMTEFIDKYKALIHHKTISIIVTQMLFSGDGAALLWKMLKADNTLQHTIHINMPNNLTDVHLFRPKTAQDSTKKMSMANRTIESIVTSIKQGKQMKMGRRWYSWLLGFFVQRLYAKPLYKAMRKKLKVNHEACVLCNKCIPICPTNNLELTDGKITTNNQCTLCYRCINTCPTQALSLFMKHGPKTQYIRDTYH